MKALPHPFASRADLWVVSCAAPAGPEDAPRASTPRDSKGQAARFAKSSKLLRSAEFQHVYKNGRRHFAAHMTVFYRKREDIISAAVRSPATPGPRIGFTVGRVLGGAVERNRIKRRLREAVRYNLAVLALPVDVVINPKKSALTAEFTVLKDEVARAFQLIAEKESRRA